MNEIVLASRLQDKFGLRRCYPCDEGIYIEYATGFYEVVSVRLAHRLLSS